MTTTIPCPVEYVDADGDELVCEALLRVEITDCYDLLAPAGSYGYAIDGDCGHTLSARQSADVADAAYRAVTP